MIRHASVMLLIAMAAAALGCQRRSGPKANPDAGSTCILVVLDGVRLDHATPELMPYLTALGSTGVVFENHRAVFPAVTSVSAATLVTGAFPATHGLLGDEIFVQQASRQPVDAGDAASLAELDRATGGRVITALTLGELMEGDGRDLLVLASGDGGLAWLLAYGSNPRLGRSSVVNPSLVRPAALSAVLEGGIGAAAGEAAGYEERNAWVTDALVELGLGEARPALSIAWYAGVDEATMENGIGSQESLEAVRSVDAELGRIVAELESRGLRESTNLIVTSDHGFIRHSGQVRLEQSLLDAGLKEHPDSTDVVVAGSEIYVTGAGETKRESVRRIAAWLSQQPHVGGVFSRKDGDLSPAGAEAGTLSYETIQREHPRAGDLMTVPNWGVGPAESRFGGVASGDGLAGHGGASPYELNVPMVAAGPGFKRGERSTAPSSHVDVAPTLLTLMGVAPPVSMDGRVLGEALRGGPAAQEFEPARVTYRARAERAGDGEKVMELFQWSVEGVEYLQWVRALYRGGGARAKPAPQRAGGG